MFLFMHHGKCWWCRNHHIGFDIRLQEETQSSAPGEISDTDSSLHSSVGSISTRDQPRGFQEDFQEQNKLPAQFLLLNLRKLSGWKRGFTGPSQSSKTKPNKAKNPLLFQHFVRRKHKWNLRVSVTPRQHYTEHRVSLNEGEFFWRRWPSEKCLGSPIVSLEDEFWWYAL